MQELGNIVKAYTLVLVKPTADDIALMSAEFKAMAAFLRIESVPRCEDDSRVMEAAVKKLTEISSVEKSMQNYLLYKAKTLPGKNDELINLINGNLA